MLQALKAPTAVRQVRVWPLFDLIKDEDTGRIYMGDSVTFGGVPFGDEGVGSSTLVGLLDTAGTPTEGQGYVYRSDALGAGLPGFGLEDFVRASVSSYAAGRILLTNGTEMVDTPHYPMPQGTQEGELAFWNVATGWTLLQPGEEDDILVAGASGSEPTYKSLSALFASTGFSGDNLATANQTLPEDRSVILGGNALTIGRSTFVNLSLDGGNDTITLISRDDAVGASLSTYSKYGVDHRFLNAGRLRYWDGDLAAYSTGEPGMSPVSGGAAAPPKWGWPKVRMASENGTMWELSISNSGALITTADPDTSDLAATSTVPAAAGG
jgi:hypothetical protein